MCGIAGIFYEKQTEVSAQLLTAMNGCIAHRGPDSEGVWTSDHVGLAHRRLSIIDTSVENTQPLHDSSGQYSLVFNGEIYNYLDIRRTLSEKGVTFKTSGDSEALLEAYKLWGKSCIDRIEGMFAFAIWDGVKKELFCARDRLGKKPFFYAHIPDSLGGGIAFASEPQAIVVVPGVDKSINKKALKKFLTLGYSLGEQTLWNGVRRLLPGHALTASPSSPLKIYEYYDFLPAFSDKTRRPIDDMAEELRGLLDECVQTRLQSDVPFGMFLSAGLDSNSVLSSMTRFLKPRDVQTFSIGFGEKSYDESSVAAQIARETGTTHQTFVLDPDQIDLEKILDRAGQEPLADASFIATYCLAQNTARHVKMVLTGDGGDELFAGYPTYIANKIHNAVSPVLPDSFWRFLHGMAERHIPVKFERMSFDFKVKQFLRGLSLDARRAHFSWRVILGEKKLDGLFNPDFHAPSGWEDVYEEFEPYYEKAKHLSPLDQSLYVDAKTWMVDSVLVKVDRATMTHGVEARSPFLDRRMAEFAARLPDSYKLAGTNKKRILKHAMAPRLSNLVFNQPKRGFSVPISKWMEKAMKSIILEIESDPHIASIFDRNALSSLLREQHFRIKDHSLTLLNIVILSRWLRKQAV